MKNHILIDTKNCHYKLNGMELYGCKKINVKIEPEKDIREVEILLEIDTEVGGPNENN